MKLFYILLCISLFLSCGTKQNSETINTDKLSEANIQSLQGMMEDGTLTSEMLVKYYQERIEKYDDNKSGYNSVMTINPDAISIAKSLDEERKAGKVRGPMHGIPVLIKDNIDSKDKMPNTGGSVLLKDNYPNQDAFIVQQLREAGAVLLGKTNLSEWANFRSTNSSSGWSSLGGQTKNAYNTDKSPCGSSAGSGVAVALDFCSVAIGTETDGSIACPSAVNGIVGIKPTVGLWSRSGIIPISFTQDTPGPMARSVKDAATFLGACIGIDPRDSKTNSQKAESDYTKYCIEGSLKGTRLGVDPAFMDADGEIGKVFNEAIKSLEAAGAEIVRSPYRNALSGVGNSEYEILLYEFNQGMKDYLANTDSPYKSLDDLIKANEENKEQMMPIFGQEIFIQAAAKGDLSDPEFKEALVLCTERSGYVIDSIILAQKLDAIIGPTLGPSWDINHKDGDSFNGPSSYSIAAQSGYPSITVPMGYIEGLPVGISFISGAYQEGKIISLAYDFEQKTKVRKSPIMQ